MTRTTIFTLFTAVALTVIGCGGGGGKNPVQPPPGGGNTNHQPTVNLNISDIHLRYNGTANLSVSASDVDGDQVSFTWTAVLGTVATSGPTATSAVFTAGTQWGQASVTVTASDGKGGTATATALTYVQNPNPPSVTLVAMDSPCGPDNFSIQVTIGEAVSLTDYNVNPFMESNTCYRRGHYNPAISVSANTPFILKTELGTTLCVNPICNGITKSYYDIDLTGTRPEPDGGRWVYTSGQWHR